MEVVASCPNCANDQFAPFLTCTDYTVTHEQFSIVSCNKCGFTITSPRPTSAEIGRYYDSPDYISHSNTTKGVINKIYHFVKSRAIQQKIELIERLKAPSKDILDIGCGAGSFLHGIVKAGWNGVGVEPNLKSREYCFNTFGLTVNDETYLKNTTQKFPIITMWHVLEHVHQLNERIAEIQNILSPGGYAIIAVPNYRSFDAQKYTTHWAAYDVPRHLYHFSEDVIKSLFKKHDLQFYKSLPMKMDSFYVSMLSEKYKRSSLGLVKALLTGIVSNYKAHGNPEKYSSTIYIFKKQ
jgi:2-polyprenyl-3-methyl-5-hydroxy-6-metoxy-1,4-benzoquinol methylase